MASSAARRKNTGSEWRLVGPPLAALVALAITYSYAIPLGYGPDEPRHFNLIKLLWEDHTLPRVLPDGRELGNAIALHPPTYYVIEGLAWYPARWLSRALAARARQGLWRRLVIGAEPARVPDRLIERAVMYRVFRMTSILWGVAVIWLVFRAVRAVWPGAPLLAAGVAWVMALWPHFLMNFATITNDCGANLAGALFVWYWACRAPRGTGSLRDAARAGLLVAIGALMKAQVGLVLGLATAAALAWPYGRRFYLRAGFWQRLGIALVVAAVLASPWYGRNLILYGRINYVPQGYSIIPRGMSAWDAFLTGILWAAFLATVSGLFKSIWAQVGWFPKALAEPIYGLAGLVVVGAAVGIANLARRRTRPADAERLRRAACILLPFPIAWAVAVYAALFVHFGWHEGGRYLLFALPGLVTALVGGWQQVAGAKGGTAVLIGFLVTANAASLYNLLTYLNPTFGATVLIGQ